MKLENLIAEQEALIPIIRDKWNKQLFDLKELNIEQLFRGIEWLYPFCKMEIPKIMICESLIEAQLTLHILNSLPNNVWANVGDNVRDNVRANVWDNVRANVGANVGANVRDNVGANVRDNVRANVGANVWDNVRANVGDNVWANVRDNVGANVRANVGANVRANVGANVRDNVGANVRDNVKIETMCSYGDINDYGWVSFFDYFTEIGVLKNEDFNEFRSMVSSNYYSMIQMEKLCVVIKNPQHILRNENNQMNSTKDYAIKFNDGTGMYFVNGLYLSDALFNKLKTKSYTFEDFTKESNEEVKSACIAFMQQEFGDTYVFDFLSKNLQDVDSYTDKKNLKYLKGTTKGMNIGVYTLFKGEVNTVEIAYVRCYCPSTDRMFFLGVDPEINNAKDAIASLYQVPRKLKPYITSINRQGERFSTTFTEEGNKILSLLSKEDFEDSVVVTGDEYFEKMQYEY